MASHSSTLAQKIPWMEEPGRLQSMGSLQVGRDRAISLSLFTFTQWRRQWQPTPVFLPGESQGRGSLVGCRLWGRTESDTTEVTQQQQQQGIYQNFKLNQMIIKPWLSIRLYFLLNIKDYFSLGFFSMHFLVNILLSQRAFVKHIHIFCPISSC